MKITYDQYAYIMNYKKKHPFKKYFCNQTIEHYDDEGYNYHLINQIKPVLYFIICVPACVVSLLYTLYDVIIKRYDEWIVAPNAFEEHSSVYAYPTEYESQSNRFLKVIKECGGYHEEY